MTELLGLNMKSESISEKLTYDLKNLSASNIWKPFFTPIIAEWPGIPSSGCNIPKSTPPLTPDPPAYHWAPMPMAGTGGIYEWEFR